MNTRKDKYEQLKIKLETWIKHADELQNEKDILVEENSDLLVEIQDLEENTKMFKKSASIEIKKLKREIRLLKNNEHKNTK